jgi:hypothetical protein
VDHKPGICGEQLFRMTADMVLASPRSSGARPALMSEKQPPTTPEPPAAQPPAAPEPPTEPLPAAAAQAQASGAGADSKPAVPAARRRHWPVNVAFGVASVIGVFAVLAVWVHRQLLNTDNWTNTSSQLLADPKIQKAVGNLLVNELFNSVDVAAEIKKVLPSNVEGLSSPAAAGLRELADQLAPTVLATPKVQEAWRGANRTAQIALVRILNGGSTTVSTENGQVVLKLHPLLLQLSRQLGLEEQFNKVQTNLSSSNGTAARGAAERRLGVKLPPLSGDITILRSSQLSTAQNVAKAIKGLAIVLPALAIGLFLLAVWMAEGWRRVALRTTGWCLIGVGLTVVLARRLIGDAVVNSLVKNATNKPAVHQAFNIGTTLLFDAAIAVITYGAAVVVAAWIAGPTRPAISLRRALAPSLREHPARLYIAAALGLVLLVIWGPFASTRQVLPVIGIAILLALGVRTLERIDAREFPDARAGEATQALRAWYSDRRAGRFAARPAPAASRIDELERLAGLHERGALTDAEYQQQKQELLGSADG